MRRADIALIIICCSIGFTAATGGSPKQTDSTASRPCSCVDGQCKCCTGSFLQQIFDVELRQRGCVNIVYDPDEFQFTWAMSFNDRVLYQNTFSGKNPRPMCVSLPRLPSGKMCVRFSNVYFVGRNLHACPSLDAKWRENTLFNYNLGCVRMGADGVTVVSPEDGGGLPQPQGPAVDPAAEQEEDYDVIDEDDLLTVRAFRRQRPQTV